MSDEKNQAGPLAERLRAAATRIGAQATDRDQTKTENYACAASPGLTPSGTRGFSYREMAADLAFDSHVRRVHAALAGMRAALLAGHSTGGEVLTMATPSEADLQQGILAMSIAETRGRNAGRIQRRLEHIEFLETQARVAAEAEKIAAEAAAKKAARAAKRRGRKVARR